MADLVGKTISHYEILEQIGQGGMGMVYKATDTKLDRLVALKFLPPHLSQDEQSKKRFIHEAKAASSLNHPNIAHIYEIDEADGQMFIAMEYIEGKPLQDALIRGEVRSPLALNEAINYAIQIAEGLSRAHTKSIVHRDIKPANVLLSEDGLVKIVDFGLAKLVGRTKLTQEGTTLGTVGYMSPEQAQGANVDQRTDIWSLCVLIYEMITGKQPFEGDYEQAVTYSIINQDPEPPTAIRTGVPMELERIVLKGLAKEPDQRYQNLTDMMVDLKAAQKQLEQAKSASGAKTKPSEQIKETTTSYGDKRRGLLVGGIALSILVCAFLVWKLLPGSSERTALQSIAVLPFADLSPSKDQEYFCDGMTEEILTKLSKLAELKVIARTSVMRYKNTDKSIKEIGDELDVASILEGSVRKDGDDIRVTAQLIKTEDESHLWAETYDKKLAGVFALQDDVSKAIAQALKVQLTPERVSALTSRTDPRNLDAYEYFLRGKHELNDYYVSRQEREYQAALDWFEKSIAIDSTYSLAYTGRSWTYHAKWVFTGYRDQELLSLKFKNAELAVKWDPNSAEAHTALAGANLTYENPEGAFDHLKKALQLNPNLAEANYSAAHFWVSLLGVYDQGLKYFDRTIELDPYFFPPYTVSAQYLIDLGKYQEAAMRLETATDADSTFVDYSSLAQLAIYRSEFDKADSLLSRLEGLYSRLRPRERAILFAAKGEKERALALYKDYQIYALLEMKAEMLEELNKRLDENRSLYPELANSPLFDRYRDDRNFVEILDKEKQKHDTYLRKYRDLIF